MGSKNRDISAENEADNLARQLAAGYFLGLGIGALLGFTAYIQHWIS
ncbi:hypothetical protein [Arcanobacterium haemolyticum]